MIVVGVDGSPPSRAALRWSVQRAAVSGDAVRLVRVLDDEWGIIGPGSLEELGREAEADLADEIQFARSVDAGVPVESELLWGNPMLELASAGADADLVVVGTHKTGFLRGRVFGSRSLQLAAASNTPVAIVPESAGKARSGIVVGVDGSPAALAAVMFAAEEARRSGEELILVGAWTGTSRHDGGDEEPPERDVLVKSAVEKALMDARSHVESLHPDLPTRVRQVNRAAAETLVDASPTATMLVIGSSRRVDAPLALGSVAHDVLINISAPTVVVHAERTPASRDQESDVVRTSSR
jgi:nucleotide-binding universal stress UspA family protein